ncbi:alanine racemase [Humisphaera borealis]|uniref:Alanine racemase n=1 Tax=Humisphaera borealis TaxID=2807512 RepID=A0A7M2X101_9BACT|nr:alanine racemase [Humisphaera borealis]QOV91373.1 alanine racemase [Humisphaera borealis]
MTPSRHVAVTIDLARIRKNAELLSRVAGVPLIGVVKADAYGLGADRVAPVIADLVDGFYVFELAEAIAARLADTGKRTIVVQAASMNSDDYLSRRAQPVVWDSESARLLRRASPVLSVDTGQQRFGVPISDDRNIDAILHSGGVTEAYTHATTVTQAVAFATALRGRVPFLHAAGTALIAEPSARLDAVRPGLALYRGAATVSVPLVEVTDTDGPAGYSGFAARRHGVVLAGYSNGLRPGSCAVNGRVTRILEVGMQSAFIECTEHDRVGDTVELMGPQITEALIATAWGTSPQEALVRMSGMGERRWIG